MDLPTIYCIVDAPNVARRARMQARFAFHGLNEIVRFVEPCVPVDGRVNGIGDDGSHAVEAIRLQSHVAALRTFLDDSAFDDDSSLSAGAIVIEDDVVLHNRFVGRFAETMCNVPPGTPTVALGYSVTDWAGFSWSGVDSTCENLTTTNPRALRFPCAYWISRQEAARVVARLDRPLVEMPVGVTSAAIVHTRHALVAYPALALTEDFGRHGKRWFAHADYSVAERGARTTTIALCMIVKNEALVIERCLQSVRHLIDSWVICDTGSSDQTIDVIERDLCDIPGRLHRTAWVDFGHNRSELLNLARGTADYLLLIDADQTISEMGCLPLLDDRSVDAYRLRHHDGIEYDVERLVRGDLPWRYVGRTHEYLTCDGHDTTSELLHAWQVIHHGDGGSRDDKFERDRVLLELSLAEDPDDPRTNFYLGQTLETLGEHALARHAYLRRAQLGSFEEEAWYAQWRAAAMIDGDPAASLAEFVAAWKRRPRRLEPLHDAVLLCERHGWWGEALELGAAGLRIERPDDILFVHSWLYEWGMRETYDRVVLAAGTSTQREPAQGCDESHSDQVADAALLLEDLVPAVTFAHVSIDAPSGWPAFNPSITSHDGELVMIVRTANYRVLADGSYEWLSGDAVRTENYFVRLDTSSLAVIDSRVIADRSGRAIYPTGVQGLEDCRPFFLAGQWRFVGTSRDSRPDAVARMIVGTLDVESEHEVLVTDVAVLPGPVERANEKNWAPWVANDQLRLVSSWLPREVLAWNDEQRTLTNVEDRTDSVDRAKWRGSSQGIDAGVGTLFVVHEVDDATGRRHYLHRFIVVDQDGRTYASKLFSFTGSPVEFASGIARRGDEVLVSFGVNDAVAAILVMKLDAAIDLCSISSALNDGTNL